VLGLAVDRLDLGTAAAFGGFTAIYGHALPYRRRAVVSAGVGLALTTAVLLGGLSGPHPAVLALALGLIAAAATAATAIWHIGPPGPLMAVLVGGSASTLGADPAVLQHAAITRAPTTAVQIARLPQIMPVPGAPAVTASSLDVALR